MALKSNVVFVYTFMTSECDIVHTLCRTPHLHVHISSWHCAISASIADIAVYLLGEVCCGQKEDQRIVESCYRDITTNGGSKRMLALITERARCHNGPQGI